MMEDEKCEFQVVSWLGFSQPASKIKIVESDAQQKIKTKKTWLAFPLDVRWFKRFRYFTIGMALNLCSGQTKVEKEKWQRQNMDGNTKDRITNSLHEIPK